MSAHLDEARWRAVLEGTLDEGERRAVTGHLEADCPVCDAFLAARAAPDALDGRVDDLLLADGPEAPADALGFERFYRAATGASRPRRPRWPAVLGAATAAAAAAVALLVVGTGTTGTGTEPAPDPSQWREKGALAPGAPAPGPATRIRLEAFLAPESGPPVALAPEAEVAAGARLALRVVLDRPACLHLWWDHPRPERLTDAPLCLEAGAQVLARGGRPLGVQLDRPGPVTLYAAPASAEAPSGPAPPPGAARVRLTVRPGTPGGG